MKGAVTFRHPPEVRARAIELRDAGLRPVDIARSLGIARTTAYWLTRRRAGAPLIDADDLRAKAAPMLEAGMTQKQVAEDLGVSRASMYRLLGPLRGQRPKYQDAASHGVEIDELILAHVSIMSIARRFGCSKDAIYNRRDRLVKAGRFVPARKTVETTDEQRRRMAEMRCQGVPWADVAAAFGLTNEQVKTALCRAYREHPELKPKVDSRKIYKTKAERDAAKRARRREKSRGLRPVPEIRKTPTAPTRPVAAAPKIVSPHKHRIAVPTAADRAAEQRAIEAAIAAGIGKRFEIERMAPGRQIQTCQHAVEYLESRGLEVEVDRTSSTHPKYRVSGGTSFEGRWMLPSPFVTAVRAFAAETTYRVIPLNEAYAQQMGA